MKSINYLLGGAFLAASVLSGCSDAKIEEPIDQTKQTTVAESGSSAILKFKSVEEMEKTIANLMQMTEPEKTAWYEAQGGFVSQDQASWDVAAELDNAKSMAEVEAIHKKHSANFLFNNNKSDEDIAPYIPSSKPGYALVCNVSGDVEIDGEVVNFNDLTAYEQTDCYKYSHGLTKAGATGTNHVYILANNRKFWGDAFLDPDNWVRINFTAHKRDLFGWNKYNTTWGLMLRTLFANGWSEYDYAFENYVIKPYPSFESYGMPYPYPLYETIESPSGWSWRVAKKVNNSFFSSEMDLYMGTRGVGLTACFMTILL